MLNLALAAALLAPQGAPAQNSPAPAAQAPIQVDALAKKGAATQLLDELFNPPTGPMTLVAGDSENPLTYGDLVEQYGELTGQYFVVRDDAKSMLRGSLNLDRTMTVPADEVQSVFEQLLKHGDFVLLPLTTAGTRILQVTSLATAARNNLRAHAIFLGPDELHLAAQHPALLFTATVALPHLDVRQVSNSLRTMITDANTQQMLPAGNSNSMIIVGFGDQVAGLTDTLRAMDAAAAIDKDGTRSAMVVRVEHANAAEISELLEGACAKPASAAGPAGPTFAAHELSNSIMVSARADQIEGIKKLIVALDVK